MEGGVSGVEFGGGDWRLEFHVKDAGNDHVNLDDFTFQRCGYIKKIIGNFEIVDNVLNYEVRYFMLRF